MSEFKFACPVCGQHITADSSASGTQLECPTCYRKIIVPQAPSSPDSKFIVSASEVNKPRPISTPTGPSESAPVKPSKVPAIILIVAVVLLCAGGAAAYIFRDKFFKRGTAQAAQTNVPAKKPKPPPEPKRNNPVPTNVVWSLDLTNASYPDSIPVGRVHGEGFACEHVILQGGTLNMRQGNVGPPQLGITIQFFAKLGEELSKKTIEIAPDRPPPVPKVTLRWRDDQDKAVSKTFSQGYALHIEFGEALSGEIPGKIYISLPDEAKSFAAGNFVADIRKPPPPKPKQPKTPRPKT